LYNITILKNNFDHLAEMGKPIIDQFKKTLQTYLYRFFLVYYNLGNWGSIRIVFYAIFSFFSIDSLAQTISGKLTLSPNQEIKLDGFHGFKTYPISSTKTDENGNFTLTYSKTNYGVGYIMTSNEKPLFVLLTGDDIELQNDALSNTESLKFRKGSENIWFVQYAMEHSRREQMLSAWSYLEKTYMLDSLFIKQKEALKVIQSEKQRIKDEDIRFLDRLPKDSYVSWFLPIRKLLSSVATIVKTRPEEKNAAITAFRSLDYIDPRLYKSGFLKDVLESHLWMIENSGKPVDSIFIEMKFSIDAMFQHLKKDEKMLNEVTNYLFDLLERQSLFRASEYLALKVLNEVNCTLESDLAKQLESYRAMKKGNVAAEINFGNMTYLNGTKQSQFKKLSDINTSYTLIIFGASWCPKCMEELPNVIQKYETWRNLGVEVVYISLDTDRVAFEQAVKTYPFFAYCDYKKWESKVAEDYYVFGTPTFYLLNNNREIILRPNSTTQMEAWVDWFLVQGNK
jgi:thiol-disulfide isomerase/thioredoxin